MALSKKVTINVHGTSVEFPSAYCKVTAITGNKESVTATIGTLSKQDGDLITSSSFQFVPALDGKNFIAQAYDAAKKLPEFEHAIDC
jgi:hypothetical protein